MKYVVTLNAQIFIIHAYIMFSREAHCAGPMLEYCSTTEVWPLVS